LGDVTTYSKPRFQQGKKVKERKWERIPLAMFGNPNFEQMSALHTRSLLNLGFFIHYVDMYYIQEHALDRYISYSLATGGSVKGLESLERWCGCVKLKAAYLAQLNEVTGLLLCLILH